ncbi:hypothetical protein M408DRAFT_73104 [Serendipita vermifera MAFF 305830]|uniref:DUF676 domain-containing protein n=1 Tax=Serendipita vermifera MAFF 305830 TaxID=933852 RepID=A0A0C3ANL1_SERVB|nr:hypothetical protein M408DRAFT_73104 [Serendipita vermifera MAFF 305830]
MQELHLLVASHGMWGEPVHLDEMAKAIRNKFSETDEKGARLHVLVAETNALDSTYDGIDWGGERLADEVLKEINELEKDNIHKVTRFSAVGYSLGGLLVRYMIGVLNQRKFFDGIEPINFTTFASPNIGLVRTDSSISKIEFKIMPKVMNRTGPQFYGLDSWSASGQPLVEVLADPKGIFYQGLAKFQRLSLYGSAYGDRTVPYSTALIEAKDPFYNHAKNGMTIAMDEKYTPIVVSYDIPTGLPIPDPNARTTCRVARRPRSPKPETPPILPLKFPLNILFKALLPLLIPLGVTAAFVKLSLDSSKSRKRLKNLEQEETFQDRLANVLRRMDEETVNAITELLEEVTEREETEEESEENRAQLYIQSATSSRTNIDARTPARILGTDRSPVGAKAHGGPLLSPLQVKIIGSLNELPFNKYAACFPGAFNSHSVIISRDLKQFPFHDQGRPVLQHWADHFIL